MLILFAASPCKNSMDLGVLVHISNTSGMEANLAILKRALTAVMDIFPVTGKGTHMSLVTYDHEAVTEFNFLNKKFHNAKAARRRIAQIPALGAGIRVDKALALANELFTPVNGDRPEKPNILLIFTDGMWTGAGGRSDFVPALTALQVIVILNRITYPFSRGVGGGGRGGSHMERSGMIVGKFRFDP